MCFPSHPLPPPPLLLLYYISVFSPFQNHISSCAVSLTFFFKNISDFSRSRACNPYFPLQNFVLTNFFCNMMVQTFEINWKALYNGRAILAWQNNASIGGVHIFLVLITVHQRLPAIDGNSQVSSVSKVSQITLIINATVINIQRKTVVKHRYDNIVALWRLFFQVCFCGEEIDKSQNL